VLAAAVFVLGASALLLDPGSALGGGGSAPGAQAPRGSVSAGRQLFIESCTSCHGWNAEGIAGVAPSLHGVGASAADFMLTTGRMPLSTIGQQPHRTRAKYSPAQIADLDAYIGSFGGPGIPSVDTSSASISEGQELFADNCSGCHQIVERGGMVTGASVPSLTSASARQVAEAVRLGPFLMPRFNGKLLSDRQVAAIARFVVTMRDPPSPGGAGIGYIGPVPEGMVTWLFALPLILLATRLIGQRTEH
jgi:ubiquinol-cytochrome c reductase cytochrome c subunit